jgi:hypothetical protein
MIARDPLFQDLIAALDRLDDPLVVLGEAPGTLAIVLPHGEPGSRSPLVDGERCASGSGFVSWIKERAEPAPFGDGQTTRLDTTVRAALRLKARSNARVEGLPLESILEAVERGLYSDEHLEARLTDVLLYEAGGFFKPHKDTPRAETMVGTLVVEVGAPHAGGGLRLSAGREELVLRGQSEAFHSVRWAAFHGDIDHEVEAVRTGERVTLAYALHRTGRPRPSDATALEGVRASLSALLNNPQFLPEGGLFLLPCARRVIQKKGSDNITADALVGRDRELARLLVDLGLEVRVKPCLAVLPSDRKISEMDPLLDWAEPAIRLNTPELPPFGELLSLESKARDDEGEIEAHSLKSYWARSKRQERCVVRKAAYATLLQEATFSPTGYFGNDHFDAYLYTFVAIQVEVPGLKERGLAPVETVAHVRHKKFGLGTIVSETTTENGATYEVKFADGTVRKLLAKFVERVDVGAAEPPQ